MINIFNGIKIQNLLSAKKPYFISNIKRQVSLWVNICNIWWTKDITLYVSGKKLFAINQIRKKWEMLEISKKN